MQQQAIELLALQRRQRLRDARHRPRRRTTGARRIVGARSVSGESLVIGVHGAMRAQRLAEAILALAIGAGGVEIRDAGIGGAVDKAQGRGREG